jgi:hypothetical protein
MVEIVAMLRGDFRKGSQSSLRTQARTKSRRTVERRVPHAVANRSRVAPILSIPRNFVDLRANLR